jgi:hypothetical protein
MEYERKIALETETGNVAPYNSGGQTYWLLIIERKSGTPKYEHGDRLERQYMITETERYSKV